MSNPTFYMQSNEKKRYVPNILTNIFALSTEKPIKGTIA